MVIPSKVLREIRALLLKNTAVTSPQANDGLSKPPLACVSYNGTLYQYPHEPCFLSTVKRRIFPVLLAETVNGGKADDVSILRIEAKYLEKREKRWLLI